MAQADLNGDGRVDVLDAFALARAVTRGTPQVGDADRHDVDLILAMAVSLDGVENE
ncbi:MAG TPA: dockerin type I domain-containing protein [Candidatus Dormibacteraeota bacterium]|nr:dockerin type I domain-containing protein [Candidatus Dormibacteraeota bacterium]